MLGKQVAQQFAISFSITLHIMLPSFALGWGLKRVAVHVTASHSALQHRVKLTGDELGVKIEESGVL